MDPATVTAIATAGKMGYDAFKSWKGSSEKKSGIEYNPEFNNYSDNPYYYATNPTDHLLKSDGADIQSILMARENMSFQNYMSSTSHQREVKDLVSAGLNPVLSANHGGASTPSGAMPNMKNINKSDHEARMMEKQFAITSARELSNIKLNQSQTKLNNRKEEMAQMAALISSNGANMLSQVIKAAPKAGKQAAQAAGKFMQKSFAQKAVNWAATKGR